MRKPSNASFAPAATTSSDNHHPKTLVYDLNARGSCASRHLEVAMTRLACLRFTLFAAFATAWLAAAAERPAMASQPNGVYVAQARVDMLPDEASATSVIIHGTFFFLQADSHYTDPKCGYMYFQ